MAGETTPPQHRARQAGLVGSLAALASALADFFESRAELLATESKSAAIQFILVAVCLLGAVLFLVLGYIFVLVTAVAAIAYFAQIAWFWTALVAAGVHFLIALICLLVARSGIKRPIFRDTIAELRKDREWLKDLETANPPPS
jgi:uncharacterized membrane protein YqjE